MMFTFMIYFKRNTYLLTGVCLVAFLALLKLSYLQTQNDAQLAKRASQKREDVCGGDVANSSISSLGGNKILVVNPYFDNRTEKLTRIIAIVHHTDAREHHCWFCCTHGDKVYTSKAVVDVHADRFGFPYGTADLTCLEPASCEPRYVVLHPFPREDAGPWQRFEIKNRRLERPAVDFTVCISTMFGEYNNILQFVQSLEMYKILGMQKVTIYLNNCSRQMEKVLDYYVAKGTVEIIPWPITTFLNVSIHWHFIDKGTQIGYYGQIAALNDCVYRNMYRSRYVLLNDVDEIILPVAYADWKTMMEGLERQNPGSGIFLFENHIFPSTVFSPLATNIPSWGAVPGVNILQHVLREPARKEVFNARKMIIDPRKVVQTSVHSVLQGLGKSVKVPMDVAMVYHCRSHLRSDLPKESLIRDTTLWRYSSSLISAVSRVLREISL